MSQSDLPEAPKPDPGPSAATGGSVTIRFQANSTEVRTALAHITGSLPDNGSDMAMRLELVLAEVLNNVVEHAYGDAGLGDISVRAKWDADALDCQINDQGAAMPGLQMPSGKPPEIDVDTQDLPEGGFGWFMIHTLTQQLSYDRKDNRNELCFSLDW